MKIVIDIETTSDHRTIHCAVTVNVGTGERKLWNRADGLREYLEGASLIIGHNIIAFDIPILNKLWRTRIPLEKCHDTLIVSRLHAPDRLGGHSLAAWGTEMKLPKIDYSMAWEEVTGRPMKYPLECYDNPVFPELFEYCQRDVEVNVLLYKRLEKEVRCSKESIELEHQVAIIIAEQERNGFKFDQTKATMLLADVRGRMEEVAEAMQRKWPPKSFERFGKTGKRLKDGTETFNPGSREQIGIKLMELGWKPTKMTPTGKPVVDERTLSAVDIPEAAEILRYLMLQKRSAQISSWLEAVQPDGRIHGRVVTNGAVTGRMSHYAPNMAQIPKASSEYGPECRECFTVSEGNVLVGCDASGLELRMLAHYMKDEEYINTASTGDVHTLNQKAAGLDTRDQAKTFIYALLYGAGAEKIGAIVGGSVVAGQKLINTFMGNMPALQKLKEQVAYRFDTKASLDGLDGRIILLRSKHSALNSLLQGAGAVIMKKALVLFTAKMAGTPYKMVVNVHDEFQFEIRPEYSEEAGKKAVQSIIEAGEFYNLKCPLNGEYKIGYNWRDTH